jgi:hypothetical protein
MVESSETLAELRGFFRAFELVNNKTNHGYTFEIQGVPRDGDIDAAIAAQFADINLTSLTLNRIDDWRALVSATLIRWFLAYLHDPVELGRLIDRSNTFSLSMRSFHKDLVEPIIQRLESLAPFQDAFSIDVQTDEFYACEWTDLVLVSPDLLLFLHFDVCD